MPQAAQLLRGLRHIKRIRRYLTPDPEKFYSLETINLFNDNLAISCTDPDGSYRSLYLFNLRYAVISIPAFQILRSSCSSGTTVTGSACFITTSFCVTCSSKIFLSDMAGSLPSFSFAPNKFSGLLSTMPYSETLT